MMFLLIQCELLSLLSFGDVVNVSIANSFSNSCDLNKKNVITLSKFTSTRYNYFSVSFTFYNVREISTY